MSHSNQSSHGGFQYAAPGASAVLEYQASGLPFATASNATSGDVKKIEFPFVTKFFTVKNNGADDLHVGFTENGVLGSNKFTIAPSSSYTGDIRVMDLFLTAPATTASYEVIAGLTQIPRRSFFVLTGALNGFSGSQMSYGMRGFGFDGIG